MDPNTLKHLSDNLKDTEKMPALFVGHGSPMNGIEDNEFSNTWKAMGRDLPRPHAILCVSAHWLTKGTFVTAVERPKTIHDFGGFPQELYDVQYPAPGSPAVAEETRKQIRNVSVQPDVKWGLDHGTWTVLRHMYPKADIPVLQLSIDYHSDRSPQYHYDLGKELAGLRRKGILILGSGNMVHNLGKIAFDKMNVPEFGFDWALEMKDTFSRKILEGNHRDLISYEKMGPAAKLAIPTPDHYFPLLYSLALQEEKESVSLFNDKAVGGSLTMTSVKIG